MISLDMSYEDKMFMKQMDNEFVRDSEGSWVAPLPFRVPRQPLPSNRPQALHRANMKEMVAVTADVQHMFHCFVVRKDHRNYLRFLWHKNNDLQENLVEYRMRVHVFGNSPSPAVATLGLRKAAQASEQEFGSHVTSFVTRDFYVDDGLTSCPTKEEAVKLMKDTQQALAKYGNLRLHKKQTDHSERNFINDKQSLRSLGFLAPVIIQGKLLLRKIVSETVDWDQPLSDETAAEWKSWRDTLIAIETLRIPRTYVPYLSKTATKELHVFSDASEKAIAAVAYLRTTDSSGEPNIGFILGKAKVAPTSGHTIPRLELSAAVLAVEITQTIVDNLDLHIDTVKFYTDSKVVLGYISNETRRFFIYVANRVEKIRKFSSPSQWNYVPTNRNPADSGTRSVPAHEIHSSEWLLGPRQLLFLRTEEF
ncbi:Hypothetical predicted protein [Mytilus galloprovincialis]|uniref:Uncharacterized protein n=1 Tax=Mytilus galloprovincialis TaxID=29158 RepID=A0A8B6CDE4_MYTGA|nr:Hypothetical predicted protein [Mytilus galloprovincialis]